MQTSESIKAIAVAIAAAQSQFTNVGSSGHNKFDNYDYAKLADYLAVIKPMHAAHGLSVITSTEEVVALTDRVTKNGGAEHAVRVRLQVRLQHTSGEWIESVAWGEGQDRADKAIYKAITGARKYALASILGLATGDDPEKDAEPASGNAGAKGAAPGKPPALPPDAKAFLDTYTDVMAKRGCKPAKAQQILRNVLSKKKIKLVEVGVGDRDKILAGVRGGEWDKFFLTPAPKTAKDPSNG